MRVCLIKNGLLWPTVGIDDDLHFDSRGGGYDIGLAYTPLTKTFLPWALAAGNCQTISISMERPWNQAS